MICGQEWQQQNSKQYQLHCWTSNSDISGNHADFHEGHGTVQAWQGCNAACVNQRDSPRLGSARGMPGICALTLRRGSAAACLRIPLGARMYVSCECCVFCQVEASASGRSLVQRSPTKCGVSECDREASKMRAWPTKALAPWGKKLSLYICDTVLNTLLHDIWFGSA